MARELFIYWHAAGGALAPALAATQAMQQALRRARPGLLTRLYRRDDVAGIPPGTVTLMETYSRDGADVDAADRAAIDTAANALLPWCSGPRHVESFVTAGD